MYPLIATILQGLAGAGASGAAAGTAAGVGTGAAAASSAAPSTALSIVDILGGLAGSSPEGGVPVETLPQGSGGGEIPQAPQYVQPQMRPLQFMPWR